MVATRRIENLCIVNHCICPLVIEIDLINLITRLFLIHHTRINVELRVATKKLLGDFRKLHAQFGKCSVRVGGLSIEGGGESFAEIGKQCRKRKPIALHLRFLLHPLDPLVVSEPFEWSVSTCCELL